MQAEHQIVPKSRVPSIIGCIPQSCFEDQNILLIICSVYSKYLNQVGRTVELDKITKEQYLVPSQGNQHWRHVSNQCFEMFHMTITQQALHKRRV